MRIIKACENAYGLGSYEEKDGAFHTLRCHAESLEGALKDLLNECYHCEGTDGYHSCGMDTTEAYEKAAALINWPEQA